MCTLIRNFAVLLMICAIWHRITVGKNMKFDIVKRAIVKIQLCKNYNNSRCHFVYINA